MVAVHENRLGQHDVGQMSATASVGIIADEHVTGLHLSHRVQRQDVRHDADEAAEMDRNVLGLAQRIARSCRTVRWSSRAAP